MLLSQCQEVDCDEVFSKHHQLRTHICEVHSPLGTKPYICSHPGCKKSFPTNHKLRGHLKTHDGTDYTFKFQWPIFIFPRQTSDTLVRIFTVYRVLIRILFTLARGRHCRRTYGKTIPRRACTPSVMAARSHRNIILEPTRNCTNSRKLRDTLTTLTGLMHLTMQSMPRVLNLANEGVVVNSGATGNATLQAVVKTLNRYVLLRGCSRRCMD